MAWCPKCKREYIETVTECKECELELINGEYDDYELLLKDSNEETVLTVFNYLNETTNYKTELYCEYDNNVYEIYALKTEAENIKKAIIMFLEDELGHSDDSIEEIVEHFEDEINKEQKSATYVSAKDKYEEHRSSAFSTLFIGILGLIYMIIDFSGHGIFNFNENANLLFNITMTSIFIIFIVVGIITYKNCDKLKKEIVEEDNLIEDLKKFFDEKISAKSIDSECAFTNESEELKYFARQSHIKEKIYAEFANADETLVDQLIDEYYPLIFKDNENDAIEVLEINSEEV